MSEPSEISTESIESEKPIKQKRVMTEAQLENLKKAREKALLKKKEMSELTKKEKELKQQVLDKRIQQINKLEEVVKKPTSRQKKFKEDYEKLLNDKSMDAKTHSKTLHKLLRHRDKVPSDSESSDDSETETISSEESDSSESSVEIVKPKKKTSVQKYVERKPRQKSTDRLVVEKQTESLENKLMRNMYANAWSSMHPGTSNPYL